MTAVGFELHRSRFATTASRSRRRRALVLAVGGWVTLLGASQSAAQSSSVGLSSVRAQRFENEALPPHAPHAVDLFALAAGDFNGDGADDLATGIPRADCMTGVALVDCGAVVIRLRFPARVSGLGWRISS